jgi:hypothetical protein
VAYLGTQPAVGQYRKLKNFESSFNGVLTSFQLEVEPGGAAYYVVPGSANQLIVSLGGVIQEPNVDYTVSSSQITFTTAPAAGLNCFIIQCGDALNTGTPGDGTVTTSKLAAGAVDTAALASPIAPTVSSINSGPLAGFRNAIINGNFDIWQRGTSFTGNEYGADRWFSGRSGTTCTMSRQAFTLGQTDVPGEPTYFCRMAATSVAGAGNYSILLQSIEGVRTFAGQQVTISFWAKADASKNIAIDFQQNFGTGGSPSTAVNGIGTVKKALTTSWQKITHTVTIPSITGKTLGTNGNDSVTMYIWFDAGSDFNSRTDSLGQQSGTFDIAQVQVEAGPVATPFERRPIGTELSLCQRYYYKVEGSTTTRLGVGHNYLTTGAVCTTFFPVPLRAEPTTLEQSGTASHYDINHANSATTCSVVPAFTAASKYMATTIFTVSSGLTIGQGSNCRIANASGYLAWSAEL